MDSYIIAFHGGGGRKYSMERQLACWSDPGSPFPANRLRASRIAIIPMEPTGGQLSSPV